MRITAGTLLETGRPLDDQLRWVRTAPLFAVTLASLAAALTVPVTQPWALALVGGLTIGAVGANMLPWRRWPASWQAAPAIGYYAVVLLFEYAAGAHIDFFYLTALPIIWLVLFHSRRLLLLGLGTMTAVLLLPRMIAPAAYPEPRWGNVIMAIGLSAIGGLAGQQLVMRTRSTAAAFAGAARRARADRDVLTAYLDNAVCLVAVMDSDGALRYLNRYAEQLLGVRTADVAGHRMFHASPDPEVPEQFRRIVGGESPLHVENDVIAADGSRRRVAWTAVGLRDDDGRVTQIVSTGVDVTEQRAAEQHYANVLSAAVEQVIFATDIQGIFTAFNAGGERLLGYRAEELIGTASVAQLYLPEQMQSFAEELGYADFQELLETGGREMPPYYTQDWTMIRKDGSRVPVSMSVSTMRHNGRPTGYVVVARDITEERAAQRAMQDALDREREAAEQLRELNQVKDDFVAMISHDLRTPLTSIVGNLELLLDEEAGALPVPQRRLLEAIDRNGRRLQNLIGDLLVLSRIESGTLKLHLQPVPVQETLAGAMEVVAAKRAKDIEVELAVPPEEVYVHGDPEQLERVLVNLLGNAFKFTPPGGRIEVGVSTRGTRVRMWIADSGIGIPADELPHVFDRFYRSNRVENRQHPGTGLGLTIARSIVEQHHGTIEVRSTVASGTTFTIDLPRLPAATGVAERERL